MANIVETLVQLVITLAKFVVEVGLFAASHALILAWVAWWLCGVNWHKAWGVLAKGGWVAVVLLSLIAALVWSAIAPSTYNLFDLFPIGNFWWQLGAVTFFVLLAFFCGWLQGVFHCAPAEISFDPPAVGHHHGHHGQHGHHAHH